MAKQDKLELDGKIIEVLPAGKFKVELKDMDTVILCYKSWKMKMSHISVIADDRVKVEVSPYDMSQWRITYRYNVIKSHIPGADPILQWPIERKEANQSTWKWKKGKIKGKGKK